MSRTLVVGDCHGALRAFEQVLERCNYKEEDTIIFLGDLADGWPDVKALIDKVISIPNKIVVLGNHDVWLFNWFKTGIKEAFWLTQGGQATVDSYENLPIPESHIKLFQEASIIYNDNNKLFVHGGINLDRSFEDQKPEFCIWDRTFLQKAFKRGKNNPSHKLTDFEEVYIGHTPVMNFPGGDDFLPQKHCEVWNLDTGAGYWGKLTIMDINTKEYWQSDVVPDLYPGVKGRWQNK